MDDAVEPMSGPGLDHNMDVVGHDAPGEQRITFSIKPQERSFDQFWNTGKRQIPAAVPLVERNIDSADPFLRRGFRDFIS